MGIKIFTWHISMILTNHEQIARNQVSKLQKLDEGSWSVGIQLNYGKLSTMHPSSIQCLQSNFNYNSKVIFVIFGCKRNYNATSYQKYICDLYQWGSLGIDGHFTENELLSGTYLPLKLFVKFWCVSVLSWKT